MDNQPVHPPKPLLGRSETIDCNRKTDGYQYLLLGDSLAYCAELGKSVNVYMENQKVAMVCTSVRRPIRQFTCLGHCRGIPLRSRGNRFLDAFRHGFEHSVEYPFVERVEYIPVENAG